MTLDGHIERWSRGWRGPLMAALIAFIAGLPGLLAVPPLDRDESRFAQATAQMLETGDFTVIRFQGDPRFKKPVGIYWLQAASVSLLSDPQARDIWAYRIPSLLGAMLAAAACAWGAAAFFGPRTGLFAGALLGSTILLSTEAFIAKTDAVLCGLITLSMAALGRIYLASRGGPPVGRMTRLLLWLGLAVGTLVKGPVAPMVVVLACATLSVWDRRSGWLRTLGWAWGLIICLAVIGPWAWAVTVATDGGFWRAAVTGDLAPKLAGGQETHGAPPGYHTLLTPILFFPAVLLLPAALAVGWTRRAEPGIRFALCWLIPAWIVFEAMPTKLAHYTLPTYGALAWLAAAALAEPLGAGLRRTGAVLAGFAGVVLAAASIYLLAVYGDPSDVVAATLASGLLLAAGVVGGVLLWRGEQVRAAATAVALGVLGHAALASCLIPRLEPLMLSQRTEQVIARARLLPRQGIAPSPVAVAGYAEPSLVFGLGTGTELGGPDGAAQAIAERRPAVVEGREQKAFEAELKARKVRAVKIGEVSGLDYSNGDEMTLRIYGPEAAP